MKPTILAVALLVAPACTMSPTAPSHVTSAAPSRLTPATADVVIADLGQPVSMRVGQTLGLAAWPADHAPLAETDASRLELLSASPVGWVWRAVNTGDVDITVTTPTEGTVAVVTIPVVIAR